MFTKCLKKITVTDYSYKHASSQSSAPSLVIILRKGSTAWVLDITNLQIIISCCWVQKHFRPKRIQTSREAAGVLVWSLHAHCRGDDDEQLSVISDQISVLVQSADWQEVTSDQNLNFDPHMEKPSVSQASRLLRAQLKRSDMFTHYVITQYVFARGRCSCNSASVQRYIKEQKMTICTSYSGIIFTFFSFIFRGSLMS